MERNYSRVSLDRSQQKRRHNTAVKSEVRLREVILFFCSGSVVIRASDLPCSSAVLDFVLLCFCFVFETLSRNGTNRYAAPRKKIVERVFVSDVWNHSCEGLKIQQ